ncbi:MAG: tetratricopeptide repeat protein [Armatimonadetes bacterium]|nr:tetratricopeptide repeat protein [Armatimonadota bacterium]
MNDFHFMDAAIEERLDGYRQRLEQNPADAEVHQAVCFLLSDPAQSRRLIDFYRHLQREFPDAWQHQLNLARAYSQTGKDSMAVVQLQKLLRNDPTLTDVWMELARCYYRLQKVELALRALNSVLDVRPDFCEAHLERVRLLVDSGDLEEAAAAAIFSLEAEGLSRSVRDWLEEVDALLESGQNPPADVMSRSAGLC